jgi:hypothetical protein
VGEPDESGQDGHDSGGTGAQPGGVLIAWEHPAAGAPPVC